MAEKRSGGTGRPPEGRRSPSLPALPDAALVPLAAHHGIPIPPGTLAAALELVLGLDVLPADRQARALDLVDQALGHLRLAGRARALETGDLEAVAGL